MTTTLSPLRPDLELSQQCRRDGVPEMVVRDPVNSNIYAFPAKAFAILAQIRAGQTLEELAGLLGAGNDEAGDKRRQQIALLIQKAAGFGLFVGAPQAAPRSPAPAGWRRKVLARLTNPVWHLFEIPLQAIEPGVRLLANFLYGRGAWLALALVAAALACLGANLRDYVGNIQVFTGFVWWWIAFPLVFLATAWHETGHYGAALKAGHKVTRGGIALVLVFPAMYVRVDDYFMVPTRRDRLLIALGGVYFDAIAFSACLFTWLSVQRFSMASQVAYVISFMILFRMLLNLIPFFKMDGCRAFEELLGVRHVRMESLAVLRSIRRLGSYQVKGLGRRGVLLLGAYGVADIGFMLFAVWMAWNYIRNNASAWNPGYADHISTAVAALMLLSFALGVRQDLRRKTMQQAAA